MALQSMTLQINKAALPSICRELAVRFTRESFRTVGSDKPPKDKVVIEPWSKDSLSTENVGYEPRWYRLLGFVQLGARDGTHAYGSGQVIITGRRFIGMIDSGVGRNGAELAIDASGKIFCFTLDRADVYSPDVVKKRRVLPSEFRFRSKEEVEVGFQFVLGAMFSIVNGQFNYWYDKDTLRAVSDEARRELLIPAARS